MPLKNETTFLKTLGNWEGKEPAISASQIIEKIKEKDNYQTIQQSSLAIEDQVTHLVPWFAIYYLDISGKSFNAFLSLSSLISKTGTVTTPSQCCCGHHTGQSCKTLNAVPARGTQCSSLLFLLK